MIETPKAFHCAGGNPAFALKKAIYKKLSQPQGQPQISIWDGHFGIYSRALVAMSTTRLASQGQAQLQGLWAEGGGEWAG